jgi:hypothetical protein
VKRKRKDDAVLRLLVPRSWRLQTRLAVIVGVCAIAMIALVVVPGIPLGARYHKFADNRTLLGLPNALDVLSNIPFFIVGTWGLIWLLGKSSRSSFTDQRERVPYLVFFLGAALTGIGSFWYHLAPSNSRLPWDLLPMTCSFISMVVALTMERVSVKLGSVCLGPLLLLGMSSVAYWYVSETLGHGNYKFYLFVQFFSPVILALTIGLFPPRYSGTKYLAAAFALFLAAKLFESFDRRIYSLVGVVSGHSLKHITAAVSCCLVLRMLQVRRAVAGEVRRDKISIPQYRERKALFR